MWNLQASPTYLMDIPQRSQQMYPLPQATTGLVQCFWGLIKWSFLWWPPGNCWTTDALPFAAGMPCQPFCITIYGKMAPFTERWATDGLMNTELMETWHLLAQFNSCSTIAVAFQVVCFSLAVGLPSALWVFYIACEMKMDTRNWKSVSGWWRLLPVGLRD